MESNDLRLKEELKIYSKRYESELRNAGTSETEIEDKVNNWIEETYQFYKSSHIDTSSAIKIFQFLNVTGAEPQTENVEDSYNESPKIR